ncbi:auxin-responsive protein IAA25 isoform X2 [Brachypodium distachyon]|uniref:Auxin-responsive protein n=3 Tax=Brachypodium distachyon TaxID=15368 RepID=A0A0Q3PZG1_BRADI|nr:auxin-responsive protein IAA25 isoform X2 [Brachypodium distachyon]KQJ94809.1 hypothetical protein BRADI_3g13370v3 [Brachypodium distachyon]|eukprot:XP_024316243.1 auxin-responsive protein IAA25 isoform X2 [Brachypodium distachyon]
MELQLPLHPPTRHKAMRRSSSAAPSLKQEQVDASNLQEGVLGSLELRLGISSDNGLSGGGGATSTGPWLGVGVHPWSLAARQDKAALEQAQQRPNECPPAQREDRPQLVGWPPVRTFRKNLCTPRSASSDDLSKVEPCSEQEEDHGNTGVSGGHERPAMFVKVNLEGYAVGRKINLAAHSGYASLSAALQSMFHGFLSDGYGRIATRDDEEDQLGMMIKNYILLYEDNEGDRMLVGDVPWEMFIASVKRLYIAHDPRADH